MKYSVMKAFFLVMAFLLVSPSFANDKITVMLDWFVNPDHAALIVAKQKGFFDRWGLDVAFIEPSDPTLPPKMVAAEQADIAVDYQPQLLMAVDEGLPLIRIATLISTPLNTLTVLKNSNIHDLSDLKGKTVGYSVSGFERSILTAMLASAGLKPNDVQWVNVNFSLSPSLITGKVDAVLGGFRNFELNQMQLQGQPGRAFYPEEHGVPPYDELILIVNKKHVADPRFPRFLAALEAASLYILNHPDKAWQAFISYKPEDLDNELNRLAWQDTLPRLAMRPGALDNERYTRLATFLQQYGVIKAQPALKSYAGQLLQPDE